MNPSTQLLPTALPWKSDWPQIAQRYIDWWKHRGLLVSISRQQNKPRQDGPTPDHGGDLRKRWVDAEYRAQRALHELAHADLRDDVLPFASLNVGAGDLAAVLGCKWQFAEHTVWFEPIEGEPADWPNLAISAEQRDASPAYQTLRAMVQRTVEVIDGRVMVGMPDVIENFDIYCSLRDPQTALFDMYDQPNIVEQRIWEINEAFKVVFDGLYDVIRDEIGGNVFSAFSLWGPGKTAKVQCDACSMFGPQMFKQFVQPALTAQCEWLDYAMYHLDGEECWPNLDLLLEIEALQAIEWTPKQTCTGEGGGHPKWYDLYKRILAAGKSVQAIAVQPDEVIPLLDNVGPAGMYLLVNGQNLNDDQAAALKEKVDTYRD